MKTNMKRLLALILALSMVMSLLSTSAWAAESSEELSVMSTVEPQEEPQEETQEETAPEPEEEEEEAQEEEPPEAEPEAEGEESEEEAEEAGESEETPAEEPEEAEQRLTAQGIANTWSEATSYSETQTLNGGVAVTADITLTIAEGATLTVNGGINATGHTLTVAGKGTLVVTGADGEDGDYYDDGTGGDGSAGGDGFTGDIIVNGATVNITGGNSGDGSNAHAEGKNGGNGGNGGNGISGNITVNSGSATLTGGSGGDRGIGWFDDFEGTGFSGSEGSVGKAVTGTITGFAQEKDDNSTWTDVTSGTSSKRYVKVEVAVSDNPYASLLNTTTVVKFDNKDWYLIENNSTAANAGTVTLLAKECVGASKYNSSGTFVDYSSNPTVKTAVDNWYDDNITADTKTAVSGDAMFLLTTEEADAITNAEVRKDATAADDAWWLCSRGNLGTRAAFVYGGSGDVHADGSYVGFTFGVRPALKLDLSKVTFDSTSKTFSVITPYPLWVGGVQVTSANKDDVLGDADDGATVKFTPAEGTTPSTLSLNGATISGSNSGNNPAAIYADGMNLTINVTGTNTVTGSGDAFSSGISVIGKKESEVNLTITGAGTLNANGNQTKGGYGVYVQYCSFTVEQGATLNATGGSGSYNSYGVNAYDAVVNVNGTLNATGGTVISGGYSYGVYIIGNGNVNVAKSGNLTATGNTRAISGKVKNAIAGTGWTDAAGTEGKADIDVNNDGQDYAQNPFKNYKKVQFLASSHTHSFTYSASGATITATCTPTDCPLPPSSAGAGDHVATLTITANGGTYDGTTAYGATITDANSIQGDAKVQYQKKTDGSYGTATETAPKDAGDYKASITVGGATASVEYTIAKAEPTAASPTDLKATYGQTLKDVTLTNPTGNTAGTWSWVDDTTTSVGNAGTNTFKANFTPTDANYNSVDNVDVTVTVSAADPATPTNLKATYGQTLADVTLPGGWAWKDRTTSVGEVGTNSFKADYTATSTNYNSKTDVDVTVTVGKANAVAATVTANSRTYDGTEKPLVTVTGEATGGTMQYALGENATTAPAENLYTTSIPTATNAGTYYVWYKVKGDANHNDTEPKPISVTISNPAPSHTHNWGDWEVTKKATCVAKGEKKRTCSGCKKEEKQEIDIDPANHVNTEIRDSKEATETEEGYTGDTWCKDCDVKLESGKSIPKLEKKQEEKTDNQKEEKKAFTDFHTLRLVAKRGTKSVTLTWRKYADADGYLIYGCECGAGSKMKLLKTIKGNKTVKWTQKKLKKGTYYKYKVVAYKNNKGKKQTLVTSKEAHTVTHDGKTTAVKAVKVNKTSVSLKKGKTFQIKASEVKENKKKKIDHHREIRYESSNKKIATVAKNGKVKGVKKGKATVWAYAQNGIFKAIQVTVK